MSTATAGAPRGRPPGLMPETRAQALQFLELRNARFSVPEIAKRHQCSHAWVWKQLERAKQERSEAAGQIGHKLPTLRANRTAILLEMLDNDERLAELGPMTVRAWYKFVRTCLRFGNPEGWNLNPSPSAPFGYCRALANRLHLTEEDFVGHLRTCVACDLLLEVAPLEFALPPEFWSLGTKAAHTAAGARPVDQLSIVLGISRGSSGSSSESSDIHPSASGNLLEPSSEIPSTSLARAVVVAVEDKITQSLNNNHNTDMAARAGEPTGNSSYIAARDSTEMKADDSTENDSTENQPNQSGPSLADLAAELAAVVKLDRRPSNRELGAVGGWLKAGIPVDLVREVVVNEVRREISPRPGSLHYFDRPVRDAFAAMVRSSESAAAPAARARESGRSEPRKHEIEAQVAIAEAWLRDAPAVGAQWAGIRAALRAEVGESDYRHWLEPMVLASVDEDVVTVNLPTRFKRDWVKANYATSLLELWQRQNSAIVDVEFGLMVADRESAAQADGVVAAAPG